MRSRPLVSSPCTYPSEDAVEFSQVDFALVLLWSSIFSTTGTLALGANAHQLRQRRRQLQGSNSGSITVIGALHKPTSIYVWRELTPHGTKPGLRLSEEPRCRPTPRTLRAKCWSRGQRSKVSVSGFDPERFICQNSASMKEGGRGDTSISPSSNSGGVWVDMRSSRLGRGLETWTTARHISRCDRITRLQLG